MYFSRFILLYSYIFLIFLCSSIPVEAINSIQIYSLDKFFHLIEYFILGFIFKYSVKNNIKLYYLLIFFIPIIDEFIIQNYSGRNVDIYDFIFDIIGILLLPIPSWIETQI